MGEVIVLLEIRDENLQEIALGVADFSKTPCQIETHLPSFWHLFDDFTFTPNFDVIINLEVYVDPVHSCIEFVFIKSTLCSLGLLTILFTRKMYGLPTYYEWHPIVIFFLDNKAQENPYTWQVTYLVALVVWVYLTSLPCTS